MKSSTRVLALVLPALLAATLAAHASPAEEAGPGADRTRWERQAAEEIDRLAARLSANPLWENGLSPTLDLPASASTEQVVSRVLQRIAFSSGRAKEWRILYAREVRIRGSLPDRYRAVLIATEMGQKIVLLKYEGRVVGWWSRVFDANVGREP